jgi:hypothetical protein
MKNKPPELKKSAGEDCGDCPKLKAIMRTDFFPSRPDYWCGENRIGFYPLKICNKQGEETMGRPKQQMLEGTTDEAPASVRDAADAYLTAKRSVAKFREKMNAALDALITEMKSADVSEMLIDDGDKKLILTAKDLVQIKARKKSDEEE